MILVIDRHMDKPCVQFPRRIQVRSDLKVLLSFKRNLKKKKRNLLLDYLCVRALYHLANSTKKKKKKEITHEDTLRYK